MTTDLVTEEEEKPRRRRPVRGNTPRQTVRIEETLWQDEMEIAEALGTDASKRIREFVLRDIKRNAHLLKLGRPRTEDDLPTDSKSGRRRY
jgi:hypothetical protein